MRLLSFIGALLLLSLVPAGATRGQQTLPQRVVDSVENELASVELTLVGAGFELPTHVAFSHDGTNRLFVAERFGKIFIIENGIRRDEPFLDLTDRVFADGLETGLFSIVFHPNYAQNGYFYVSYDGIGGATYLVRYQVMPDNANLADPNSGEVIMAIEQTSEYHHAFHLEFGLDGYLYYSVGDGGPAVPFEDEVADPFGHSQNPRTFKGKVLRLDVDSAFPYAIPPDNPFGNEVWYLGVRSPWRFSFDSLTGDFYIGDVGEQTTEEISFVEGNRGGANFGWSYYEGSQIYPHPYRDDQFPPIRPPENPTMPIIEYDHDTGCAVTAGHVYRGQLIPELDGVYIYGDFCFGTIWGAKRDESGAWTTTVLFDASSGINIVSFGKDDTGELYVVDFRGNIFKLSPDSAFTSLPNAVPDPSLGSMASINGAFYEPDGATPLYGNALVTVLTAGTYQPANPDNMNFSGNYSVVVPPGSYVISVAMPSRALEFYRDAGPFGNNATPVTVAAGERLENINFSLDPGGVISGTVFADDGFTPLPNANVGLYGTWVGGCSNADGKYQLHNVPFNISLIVFAGGEDNWCGSTPQPVVRQWYPGANNVDQAQTLRLSRDAPELIDINFFLSEAAGT